MKKNKPSINEPKYKSILKKIDLSFIILGVLILVFSGFNKYGFVLIIPLIIIHGAFREDIKNYLIKIYGSK